MTHTLTALLSSRQKAKRVLTAKARDTKTPKKNTSRSAIFAMALERCIRSEKGSISKKRKMKANKNYILVSPDDTLTQNFGIILADMGTADQAPITGVVKYAGDLCAELKVGDRVLFEQGTGLRHHIDGETMLLMDEDSVLATLDGQGKIRK